MIAPRLSLRAHSLFFCLAALSTLSIGQTQGQVIFPIYIPIYSRVLMPDVKSELGIISSQQSKIEAIFGKHLHIFEGDLAITIDDKFDLAAKDKGIAKVLSSDQLRRYHEIYLQREGMIALYREPFATLIGLSDDQRKKAIQIGESYKTDYIDGAYMLPNDDPAPSFKFQKDIKERFCRKVEAILTEKQKSIWNDLLGKEFKGKW